MTALTHRHHGSPTRLTEVALALGVAVLVLGVVAVGESSSTRVLVGGLVLAAIAAALFLTPRLELGLLAIALYVGLLDGPVKLTSTNPVAPLLRDVIIYAVVAGGLARWYAGRETLRPPPLTGMVVVCCAVVLVQALNPDTTSLEVAGAGIRQLLEFVPLFFVAFAVLDSEARLRAMLLVLLVVGAANGIVTAIQFPLTAQELAGWGPGYSDLVNGTGGFENGARVFGEGKVRPMGLGGDMGVGGIFGVLGLPAGLALIAAARTLRHRVGLGALTALCVLGVVTSQARASLLAAAVTILVFLALVATSRRAVGMIVAIAVLGLAGIVGASVLGGDSGGGSGVYFRYGSLKPSEFVAKGIEDRGHAIPALAEYLRERPFGAGLASSGPARQVQRSDHPFYNTEGAANFLVIEIGIAGLLAFLALFGRVAISGARRTRRLRGDPRLLLAAVLAPLFGIAAMATFAPVVDTTPTAPYLWIVAGIVARWLLSRESPAAPAS